MTALGHWRWGARAAAVAVIATLLVLLARQIATASRDNGLSRAVAAGRRPAAPDFDLARLDGGGSLQLSALRGKVVVLNFWASWCVPCSHEAATLEAAWLRWRRRGVVVVGVDAQDFRSDARAFLRRHGVTYPNVHDGPGHVVARYGVTGFPETWFVGRDGKLIVEHVGGPLTAQRLERDLFRAAGA